MTLKALVRERIENGKDMPTDIFNVFVGNRTITKKETIAMSKVGNTKEVIKKEEGALAINLFEADAEQRYSKHKARRSLHYHS